MFNDILLVATTNVSFWSNKLFFGAMFKILLLLVCIVNLPYHEYMMRQGWGRIVNLPYHEYMMRQGWGRIVNLAIS